MHRSKTSGRNDDNLETLEKRFKTFEKDSLPIVDFYAAQDKCETVDADRSIEEIYAEVREKFLV